MQFAKEFIHRETAGDAEECSVVKGKAKQLLEENYETLGLKGYLLLHIEDSEDAEDNLILSDYTRFTAGRFPFIYARVQPGGYDEGILPLMESLGFEPIEPGYIR